MNGLTATNSSQILNLVKSMEVENVVFEETYDGEDFNITVSGMNLKGQYWTPEGKTKFVYVFVHGLGAYITFKKDFFKDILSMGGSVFAADHIGHGNSPGGPTSCTINEIMEETHKVIEFGKAKFPNVPVVLHGHSMGGLTVIAMCYEDTQFLLQNVSCVIAESPWISACPQRKLSSIEIFGIKCLRWITPQISIPSGVSFFSDDLDKEWVEFTKNNPHTYSTLTPRLYLSVLEKQQMIHASFDKFPTALPLLFLQGECDPLVDAKESDVWMKALLDCKRDGVEVHYKLYPKGSHVMLKSKLRGEVAREMINFIETKCGLR